MVTYDQIYLDSESQLETLDSSIFINIFTSCLLILLIQFGT